MQSYSDTVQRPNGAAVRGAYVHVTDDAGAPASLFSDNGATSQANPMRTGADGGYSFFAANGRYCVTITAVGFTGETSDYFVLFDPADAGDSESNIDVQAVLVALGQAQDAAGVATAAAAAAEVARLATIAAAENGVDGGAGVNAIAAAASAASALADKQATLAALAQVQALATQASAAASQAVAAVGGLAGVALAAPANVAAFNPTSTGMSISGNAVATAAGYNIYRGGIKQNTALLTSPAYTDSGLSPATLYTWVFTTVNSAGVEGPPSGPASQTTLTATLPVAPTGVTATGATTTTMNIAWTAVSGASGYNVYRGTTRINPGPVTGTSTIDTGLTASTAYSWTVKAVNTAGEGPASTAAANSTIAAASSNSLTPAPWPVLETYFGTWPPTYLMSDVPPQFNVIKIFTAVPQGALNASGTRDGVGDGTFGITGINESWLPHFSSFEVQKTRDQGRKVILVCGGAGAGFNFQNSTQVTNFVNSFKAMATLLGGVDGCEINTFEAYVRNLPTEQTANNPAMIVSIATQLRAEYGVNFMFQLAPAADTWAAYTPTWPVFSPLDGQIALALNAAGFLTRCTVQLYDFDGYKLEGAITAHARHWCTGIGDPKKIVLGLSANYNLTQSPTLAESIREYRTSLAENPTLGGASCWTSATNMAEGNLFGVAMRAEIDKAVAPVVIGESAVTDAFAYSGGQNGAWFDPSTLSTLRTPSNTAAAVQDDPVMRLLDRSANTNDIFVNTSPEVGNLQLTDATFRKVFMFKRFVSSTGGGSGDTTSNGFFLCWLGQLNAFTSTLWDDASSAFTGRTLRYTSSSGGIAFSVGTGAARTSVAVPGLVPVNTSPNGLVVLVKAWHDQTAGTINLQVNGGAVVSAACANVSAGSANFALPGAFSPATSTEGNINLFQSVHTLNPLTPTLRDNVASFVGSKKP